MPAPDVAAVASSLTRPFPARSCADSAWNELGKLLHATGRLDGACDALERARALAPREGSYCTNLATVLRASGRFREARAEFARADELGQPPEQSMLYATGVAEPGAPPPAWRTALQMPHDALSVPAEWQPSLSAVHVTRVASAEECAWVVQEAERYSAAAEGGWNSAGHHDKYPTCDVVVAESEALLRWTNTKLRTAIWPSLAAQFGVVAEDLWLQACALHCTALHCTALHCTALHAHCMRTALHCMLHCSAVRTALHAHCMRVARVLRVPTVCA